MIFPPTTKQDGPQLNITINGQKILQVTQTKFLGIIIESNLTWQAHIKFIRNKVAKSIGIIQKARIILDEDTLIGLYYSFLYPYFSSGITIWGKANKSVLDPLLKLQKKAVRLVFNKPQKTNSLPLFIKANILPLNVIYTSEVSSFMFKVHHNLLPNIITNLFTKRNQSVHKTTRQSEHYNLPPIGGNVLEKSIFTQSPIIFNKLIKDSKIELNTSIHSFKRYVKAELIANVTLQCKN